MPILNLCYCFFLPSLSLLPLIIWKPLIRYYFGPCHYCLLDFVWWPCCWSFYIHYCFFLQNYLRYVHWFKWEIIFNWRKKLFLPIFILHSFSILISNSLYITWGQYLQHDCDIFSLLDDDFNHCNQKFINFFGIKNVFILQNLLYSNSLF